MERVVHRGGMVRGGGHRGGMIPRRRGRPRKNPLPVSVAAAAISPPVEVEVELEEEVEELVEGAGSAVAVPTADMTGVDGASTKRKPNFSSEEDKALVEAYHLRRSAICGRGGNKPAREAAWEEMVEIVNAVGNHSRTMLECRKHLNDLRWRAKEKVLRIQASQKKGGSGHHTALRLTPMEEVLVGNYSHAGVHDATRGGFHTSSNPSHYRVGWNQKTSPAQNEGDMQDTDAYSGRMEEDEEEEEEEELELRWEWEESDGSWNVYTAELNREMTQAYRAGQSFVTVTMNAGNTLHLDLNKMVQQNVQTRTETRVRVSIEDHSKYYFWQWEREDGHWIPYTAETSIVLERAYRKKKEVLFTTFGRSNYTMDLRNMVQINNKTKYRRDIMRKESKLGWFAPEYETEETADHNRAQQNYTAESAQPQSGRSRGPTRRSEQVKAVEEETTIRTMEKDSGRDKEGMLLRWEWEDEHGSWNIYSPEISRDITLAFREGLSSVTVYLNSTTSYHLDLWRMVQQDVHTGSEKRVRVALEDRGSYYIWQWEGDDGSWIPCSAQTSVTLEAAHRSDMKTIVMAFGSTQYTLDLARMVQINNKTKFRRKLRRKELGQDDCLMVSKQADNSFPEILQVFGAFVDYEDPESRTRSVTKLSSVHHRTRMNWSVDETIRLLNFISSRKQWDVYTPSNKGNGAFFKLASDHLKAGGYKKSGIQCRAKWKVLKRQYLTAIQLCQTGKVSSVKMPPFYTELKKMFDSVQHTGTSEIEYSSDEDCEQMGSPSPHSSEPGPAMLPSSRNDTEEQRRTSQNTVENPAAVEEVGHADSDPDCDGMIDSHEGMSSNDGTVVLQRMDMLIDGMNTLNQSVTTLNQCMNSLVRGVQNISRTSLAQQSILQQLLDIFKNGHQPVTPRGTPKLGQ